MKRPVLLLIHELVKSGLRADGCKITVCLGAMYNDKMKILNCNIKLLNWIYTCNNWNRDVGYVI